MKRVFGVKVGGKYVAFDELGMLVARGDSMLALEIATPGCERRCAADLVCEGWRVAARADEIESARLGVAWALAPGAPFRVAPSVRLLGAVIDALSELRRLAPWSLRRFPLEVSSCTPTDCGDRVLDWEISAPDPTALLVEASRKRLVTSFVCDPWADAENGIPHVTRTRWGKVAPFRRNDELVELEAVLDVALQVARGEDGLVGANTAFAGDYTSASAVCAPLWIRRSA